MADAGYTLQEAGAQLGHSHATMTEHYSGIYPDALEARASLLDAIYRKPSPESQPTAAVD